MQSQDRRRRGVAIWMGRREPAAAPTAGGATMTRDEFWALIDQARGAPGARRSRDASSRCCRIDRRRRSTWELWGAAYVAGVVEGRAEREDMLHAAWTAYQRVSGREPPPRSVSWPELDDATAWDFDDAAEMKRRYPRLWAKFGD